MAQLLGVLEQGLIYAILALGVYITFKILDFPDMTVDSSFPLGAAVTALMISNGIDPLWSLPASLLAGALAGTITGVGETVKAWTNDVRIVAVEPYESQALSSGLTGSHGIPDIGFGLVPGNYNSYVVDNIAAVTTADAVRAAQRVLRTDAIPASPSAGAALHAAAQLIANGKSRSALAVFSARQNIL